jgi:hypothetical protein
MREIQLPPWLKNMPEGHEKDACINRFFIRLAALYATPEGTLLALANLIDINYQTLRSQMNLVVRPSHQTREGIRLYAGKAFLPPEFNADTL